MQIRPARISDIPAIIRVFDAARNYMCSHGNPHQWPKNYPGEIEIKRDLAHGSAFVCLDTEQKVCGYIDFEEGPEPSYHYIEGAWLDGGPYHVIHRIATLRQGQGIGSYLLDWACTQAQVIRIDTHHDNYPMQQLLKSRGFRKCGVIYLETGDARLAFELTQA
ncbi:GNAT family N-acetyltransferase [uncultured Olegusella sp.]|uniref:GNAT family N-acetyltransferase n=1 Tax=uncultured Olegusella sp. TaxID=1979846 RepID=UPI00262EDAEA|nr:GNAT family N-acetyltransferase [uncultured Olegusella sp.]